MHRVRRDRSAHLVSVPDLDREPTEVELAAIEEEMPLIEAQTVVVDAEAELALSPANEVAWRKHRRAVRRVLALAATSVASVPVVAA